VVAQQPKQAVSGGVQEQPELVGQETVAAQAVGFELQLQFLDAVFHVAPQHIDIVIDELGIAAEVGDHEALINTEMSIFPPWQ
jgi:hypothetical protein